MSPRSLRKWFQLRTHGKLGINAVLEPLGLRLTSSVPEKTERERLQKLKERDYWSQPRYTAALALNDARHLKFLRQVCGPHAEVSRSFPWTREDAAGSGYFLNNGYFGTVDAEVLYGIIREFRPRQVVEIGSGFSSRLTRRAITDGATGTRLTCIDPAPRTEIRDYADEHLQAVVEDLDPTHIPSLLTANDILFIDSSHMIQTGGDVPYLFLEVLPRLGEGVLVHVHDIFLPFDYPESWMAERRWGKAWSWTEQYLVHAFLAFNHHFEILWPGRAMWESHRDEIAAVIPSAGSPPLVPPTSLWLRKVC
jgi:predicted O-methyltransferase YrrM